VERRLAAWRAPSREPAHLLGPMPLERRLAASRATVNPALPSRPIAYRTVAGDLFVAGASVADVRQARVADCYYLAGLAAVAHVCPQCVESMIRPGSAPGRAIARIFKRRPNSTTLEPRWYEMEPDFPFAGNEPWAGLAPPSAGRPELWPAFGEKAYARSEGGYHRIDEGHGELGPLGPQSALEAITGMPAKSYSTKHNQAELWDRLVDATRGHRPVIAATPPRQKSAYEDKGIYAKHCYPVLDVSTANHSVKVRNIWGFRFESDVPQGFSNAPEFWLPFDQFVAMFQGVAIGSELGRAPSK
jgi:hypothetical protein